MFLNMILPACGRWEASLRPLGSALARLVRGMRPAWGHGSPVVNAGITGKIIKTSLRPHHRWWFVRWIIPFYGPTIQDSELLQFTQWFLVVNIPFWWCASDPDAIRIPEFWCFFWVAMSKVGFESYIGGRSAIEFHRNLQYIPLVFGLPCFLNATSALE